MSHVTRRTSRVKQAGSTMLKRDIVFAASLYL
jgi:hypothetical protein